MEPFLFSRLWQYNTNLTIADPSVRHWRWNSNTAPTQLAISVVDDDVENRSVDLATVVATDRVAIRSTSTAQNWALFEVLGPGVDLTTWFRFDVELLMTGEVPGLPGNNERTLFDFLRVAVDEIPEEAANPIEARRDEMIARVASLLHVASDDVWVAAAVDSAMDYAISATNRDELGLPDTPLTVNGVILFAQRLYTDSPGGAMVAIGDPSFEPIFQPESLWKHVRHYFDHLDVAWGVA